jgi:secondary thiamine-phosphate synthase enzyme
MIKTLTIQTPGQGLHEFTNQVREVVDQCLAPEGLCTLFIQHTSASMTIQENADPSARRDLEDWMCRHVPEDDPNYTHTMEGPDDMPSHIKAAITSTSLSIPIIDGELALGTWQGIFLWEHRTSPKNRRVIVHISA